MLKRIAFMCVGGLLLLAAWLLIQMFVVIAIAAAITLGTWWLAEKITLFIQKWEES